MDPHFGVESFAKSMCEPLNYKTHSVTNLLAIYTLNKRHHSGKYGASVLLYCPQRKVSRGGASIDENEKIARAMLFGRSYSKTT